MVENENMEITRIVDILKRKKLVILAILIIFMIFGYLYSYHYIVPKYKATSSLLLIPSKVIDEKIVTTSELNLNSDLSVNSGLIETYRTIGENPKIIKEVIHNLGLNMTEEELLKQMEISTMKDTYVIQVTAIDENPEKAMNIVKEFDEVFLKQIKEIYHLDNIGIVDEAQLPQKPYNINHIKDMIIFFLMGSVASTITIMFFYVFDNTIKKEEDIEKYSNLKVLGAIPINPNKKQEIVNRDNGKFYITECINTIRTNILYRNVGEDAKTILITSCTPKEGKSWISTNIANAFTQTNRKVLLIDADMRKGRIHKIFEEENLEGLSNYLYDMTGNKKEDIQLAKKYIKPTKVENLHILTNGTVPPNPSELLESDNMKEMLAFLKEIYDIIILDAPPCQLVTDSIILSTVVDSTILVANSEETKIKDFCQVKKSIQMVEGNIIGAILNKKKVTRKTYKKENYYALEEGKKEEVEEKEIDSIDEMIKQAILKVEEREDEISLIEKSKQENTKEETNDIIGENNINIILQKIEQVEKNVKQEISNINNQENLTKEQVEEIIKQETNKLTQENLTKEQVEEIIKQEVNKLIKESLTKEQVEEIIKQEVNKLTQENLTKEQVEEIMRKEVSEVNQENLTKEEIEEITKQVIKDSMEKLLNKIKEEKNIEQQMQLLISEKINEMQEETQELLKQEIMKVNYQEPIMQINGMLTNLKDSYLELANKIRMSEVKEVNPNDEVKATLEETVNIMEEENGKKIIDFKALRKQKGKKKAYSIYEDIYYEDLEQTAVYVVPLPTKKAVGKE